MLLIAASVAIGILHTIVPDHWAPIALLARQHGWSRARTARTAALAGVGHTVSTLVIAIVVWGAGAVLAVRFGNLASLLSSIALIVFGGWIAIGSWRELRSAAKNGRERSDFGHAHLHRHADGLEHRHWHHHDESSRHESGDDLSLHPVHDHDHKASRRTALLLILGSSPMVEGIPAFFAAGRYGAGLLAVMAALFAASTIATYTIVCVASAFSLQRLKLGRFEEYGEVFSGSFVALLGVVFAIWPMK